MAKEPVNVVQPVEVPFGGPIYHDSSLLIPVSILQQVTRLEHQSPQNHLSPAKTFVAAVTTSLGNETQLQGGLEEPPDIWQGVNNNLYHQRGRVGVIWNPQIFQVTLLHANAQCITVKVVEIASGDTFLCSVGPWCVCGDFNNVLNYNERIGGEVTWEDIAEFRECVHYCVLYDIKSQGAFFTWNNKHNPSSRGFSRIDRFLVNDEWLAMYPDAYAHFLPEGLFDHNPCVCFRTSIRPHRRPQFRYYNMWSLDSEYKNIVSTVWSQTVRGSPMFQVVSKLTMLKKPLKTLDNNRFSDVEKAVGVAKSLLEDLQLQMHACPTDAAILAAEKVAADSYRHLCKAQYSYLCQKAKITWTKFGDENTQFFYNQIRARQVTTHIHVPTVRTGQLVIQEHCSILLAPVTSAEIKEFIQAIQNFFQTSQLLRQVNTTTLTLIPKVTNPKSVLEFRPIACCNIIYKAITKVMCLRLNRVLPDIINESQGGFVKNRNIMENILICQDLVRMYNRKVASPRCLIKIDLKKAYDSVEWNFLSQMLNALKFPKGFINLVMACVTSPSYSLSVNGSTFGFFLVKEA
ncbi:uncharacterized protein LOC141613722 [Silene latifolia]|uniref:uncharacterized protein LOC141613722 n=1 Tax=Silene latifolia TaxID=37657 RepID=UPI003D771953